LSLLSFSMTHSPVLLSEPVPMIDPQYRYHLSPGQFDAAMQAQVHAQMQAQAQAQAQVRELLSGFLFYPRTSSNERGGCCRDS
jgi:hypothetical protein